MNPYNQTWQSQQFPPVPPPQTQTPFDYFSKPPQPTNWYMSNQGQQANWPPPANQGQSMNAPYPPPKQNGLLAYFQDKDGHVDLDKMFSTVGQFANTFQQITPVVKQVGSFMKNLRV
ncbi:YppG family protein [Lentibacillus daqui]